MGIRLRRGVVLTEADGQAVLTGTGRRAAYYRLNGVGAMCLGLVLEGRSEAGVAEEVSERYAVEPEQVARDLRALLDDLLSARLVVEK